MFVNFKMRIQNFLNKIKYYYNPVVEIYNEKYNKFINDVFEFGKGILSEQQETFIKINKYFDKIYENYDNIYDIIKKCDFKKMIKQNEDLQLEDDWDGEYDICAEFISNLEVDISDYFNCLIFKKIKLVDNKNNEDLASIKHYLLNKYSYSCDLIIDINNFTYNKQMSIITKNEDLQMHITNECDKLHNKIIEDIKIDSIIKTKILQNNLYIIRKSIAITIDINRFTKNLQENLDIRMPININDINSINTLLIDLNIIDVNKNFYDIKQLKRNLCLEEFRKFLIRHYKKKVVLNKKELFETLLYKADEYNKKVLHKLYKKFIREKILLENKIKGIKFIY